MGFFSCWSTEGGREKRRRVTAFSPGELKKKKGEECFWSFFLFSEDGRGVKKRWKREKIPPSPGSSNLREKKEKGREGLLVDYTHRLAEWEKRYEKGKRKNTGVRFVNKFYPLGDVVKRKRLKKKGIGMMFYFFSILFQPSLGRGGQRE